MEHFSPNGVLGVRIQGQKLQSQSNKTPLFYRNLEEALNVRRTSHSFYFTIQNTWQASSTVVDFCSNDLLSLGASGQLRDEFLAELDRNPNFPPGSGGARVIDGNSLYLEQVEEEIARFHGAEAGLLVGSGFEGNVAIWTAIPRLGDVIVYDALVHASTHEGMNQSLAIVRREFAHNSIESLRKTLLAVLDSQPLVREGKRSVLVAVESVYSMDGDICPLQELVQVATELLPDGCVQFVVDEAHATGVIGPNGAGLVCELGLEKDIAVRLHTYSKAMSSNGAIILGNETIRAAIVNFGQSVRFSAAPSFPFVAVIRAGYNLLRDGRTQEAQDQVQHLVRLFLEEITTHPLWKSAQDFGFFSIPLVSETGWEEQPFFSHIVPIWVREPYNYWLFFHLTFAGFCVFPVDYPTVPKGQTRLKVTIHAKNSDAEVKRLAMAVFEWVQEMLDIQKSGDGRNRAPKAASQVYEWMATKNLTGFGMLR